MARASASSGFVRSYEYRGPSIRSLQLRNLVRWSAYEHFRHPVEAPFDAEWAIHPAPAGPERLRIESGGSCHSSCSDNGDRRGMGVWHTASAQAQLAADTTGSVRSYRRGNRGIKRVGVRIGIREVRLRIGAGRAWDGRWDGVGKYIWRFPGKCRCSTGRRYEDLIGGHTSEKGASRAMLLVEARIRRDR